MYCVVVGCGWLCAREWDIVFCALLAVSLARVDGCGLLGCLVSLCGFVGARTSYRCVTAVVLVDWAVARCLCRGAVRRLRVLLLCVALMWLVLLLLSLLLRLMMSN